MTRKALFLLVFLSIFSTQLSAANIVIKNNDGPGEGFNDLTDSATVPARKGNNPGATVGELRLTVFTEAAKQLGAILKSNVTITIGATFDPLACSATSGTLGQAGATASAANSPGMIANTAYGISLAESLAGANLNGGNVEINAIFNSDVDAEDTCLGPGGFYYGLDGNAPANTSALFPVVLHEIAHGLGFQSFSDVGPGGSGAFTGVGQFPDSYSRNLKDQSTGKSWDQMNNAERKVSAVNEPKLAWTGAQVTADRGMFLGPAPEFVINGPFGIAGTFPTVLGDEPTIVIPGGGVTGGVIDGNTLIDLNMNAADGCTQLDFGQPIAGKVVLFDKSPNCTAAFPAFFLEFEGAIAVVIIATTASGLPDVGGQISNQEITIPYVGVTKAVGDALRANLGSANVTIRNSTTDLLGTRAGRVVMYAPAVFESGSSVSHWSKSASPNLLMEPAVNRDLGFMELDLTTAAFKDTGWSLMSGAPGVPDKPTGTKATDGVFADRVRVTFNTVPGATVYRGFRCLTTGQTCGTPIKFPKTGTFDDTGGIPGEVYYYRVRACNETGCGKFSSANTGFSSSVLAKPTNVRATDGAFTGKVQVTFNEVTGTMVYRVFRCPDKGQTCGLPIGFPKNLFFDDKKGISGTVYFYRVRACAGPICGKFSAANAGHRGSIPAVRANAKGRGGVSPVESEATNSGGAPSVQPETIRAGALPVTAPIPVLTGIFGRSLLILMILGFGLVLIRRRFVQTQKQAA